MELCTNFSQALSHIKPGSAIFVHGGAATPIEMLKVFASDYKDLKDIELMHLHTEGECLYADSGFENTKITNLFTGRNLRGKIDFDRIDYLPCFLSEIPMLFRRGGKPVDVALIQVSPPDKHGNMSLGVSVDVAKAAVDCASLVIAHINDQMPRVHGNGFIHSSKIDYGVELSMPIFEKKRLALTEAEIQIGKHVANLVEDGATLQLGIGAIPDAAALHLTHHQHLGLHSEMWSDGALELIEKGVIDNSRKKFHRGISTSAFMMGTKKLYDYVNDNLSVLNFESDYINFPINVMRNPKVTAINSAVEIDLTGQVCADSVGHKIISGVGGQMDFMRAAALSEGGKPIIALNSQTSQGISRIQLALNSGAGVVTTRSHVHYVVTEYGSVNLYGKTLGERAKLLISIAHPNHRERLERSWSEMKAKLLL